MRFTIRGKLITVSGVIAAVVVIFVALSFMALVSNARTLEQAALSSNQVSVLKDLRIEMINIWQYLTDASLTQDDEVIGEAEKARRAANQIAASFSENNESLSGQVSSLQQEIDDFFVVGLDMKSAYAESKAAGDVLMERFDTAGARLYDAFAALEAPMIVERDAVVAAYTRGIQIQTRLIIGGGLATAIFILILGFVFSLRLSGMVRYAASSMKALAVGDGDLNAELPVRSDDELGDMVRYFNLFLGKIRNILMNMTDIIAKNDSLSGHLASASKDSASAVGSVLRRVKSLRSGSEELDSNIAQASSSIEQIMQSVASLAKQVEQQFSSIEHTSSTTEQIMASVGNVAHIAENRLATMEELVDLIVNGGEKVKVTNEIIDEIQSNADAMLGFVEMINNISDQTNLLAMNASIEAAHAGDAGRGFAVVAGEIRKLSEDTRINAGRIGETLKTTTEKILLATEAGAESRDALDVIDNEVKVFSNALKEVSSSMSELSAASGNILESMSTLMSSSEEVRRASKEMESGSQETLQSILHIKEVSSSSLESVGRIDEVTGTLNKVTLQVSAFGNQNRYNNTLLAGEARRFNFDDNDDESTVEVTVGIDWSDLLSVGIGTMDDEHKELFRRINALLEQLLSESNEDPGQIGSLVGAINEYIEYHFRDEEKMLEGVSYPELEPHKKLHAIYEQEFSEIEKVLRDGDFDATLLVRIQDKVVNWLLDHIAKVDKKYGVYIAEREASGLS